jgi:large subunit ribosomal protein L21
MFAVISTGGKQYRVSPGDLLVVEKLDGEPGAEIAFDRVLMMGEGEEISVGAPAVEGALVRATLVETRKGEKIKIFKKIRRQGYRRTRGHRQWESVLRVTGIEGSGKSAKWDGEVDLTPRSVLTARARGMKAEVEQPTAAPAPAAQASDAPAAEAKPARRKAAKAAPAEESALEGALIEAPISETPAEAPQTVANPEAQAGEGAQVGTETTDAAPKKTRAKKAKPAAEEAGEGSDA